MQNRNAEKIRNNENAQNENAPCAISNAYDYCHLVERRKKNKPRANDNFVAILLNRPNEINPFFPIHILITIGMEFRFAHNLLH